MTRVGEDIEVYHQSDNMRRQGDGGIISILGVRTMEREGLSSNRTFMELK